MYLSASQRNLIERVVNAAEAGRSADYSTVAPHPDAPNDIRQTCRPAQTEYGNLRRLAPRSSPS